MAKPTIFISSTFDDLVGHRAQLYDALVAAGYHVERMEDFGSSGMPPVDTCCTALDRAAAVIVLIGHRYGSYAPTLGVSYTEVEYEYAPAVGLPIFAYVRAGFAEGVERSPEPDEAKDQLRRLHATVRSELVASPKHFATPDDLVRTVLADLRTWLDAGLARRPSFRKRKADIDDVASYAAKTVLRKHAQFLAPRIVLVDLSASGLPKTPSPMAGRLPNKLWKIKRELDQGGYSGFLFTDLPASGSGPQSQFDQRLHQVAATDAIVVCFAKDERDLERFDRFAGVGSARFLWYRDHASVAAPDIERQEQWTSDALASCAVAVEVEQVVGHYIERKILSGIGTSP